MNRLLRAFVGLRMYQSVEKAHYGFRKWLVPLSFVGKNEVVRQGVAACR